MTEQQYPEQDIERRLRAHLQAEAGDAPASDDLWSKIEARLDPPDVSRRRWFSPGRLLGPAVGFAAALGLMIAFAGVLTFAPGSLPIGAGGDPTPTPPPFGIRGPSGSPGTDEDSSTSVFNFGSDDNAINTGSGALDHQAQPTSTPAPAAPTPTPIPSGGTPPPTTTFSPLPNPADDRQVISSASVSVEVEDVRSAVTELRAVVETLGGFVEQISTSGGTSPERGTATVRVPRQDFFTAVERIEALGEVQGEHLGQEDVTGQAIDLEARLLSEQRKEASLLELLDRATTVSDVLTIERELSRVRAEVERLQGQIAFLERSVDLSTITVTLTAPQAEVRLSGPPQANMLVEVKDVETAVREIGAIVSQADGVIGNTVLSVQPGRKRAFLVFEVPAGSFDTVMASIESMSTLISKESQQVGGLTVDATPPDDDANARIDVTLEEIVDKGLSLWLTVGTPIGVVVLLAIFTYVAYRAGRNKGARV